MEILERVSSLKRTIDERLGRIEAALEAGIEPARIFSDGLKAYRERTLREELGGRRITAEDRLRHRVRQDSNLSFPHRKILDCLMEKYDLSLEQFQEVHFSKLVREARVGKNRAKAYLSLLEQKGYVEKRDDGYRIFFRLKG